MEFRQAYMRGVRPSDVLDHAKTHTGQQAAHNTLTDAITERVLQTDVGAPSHKSLHHFVPSVERGDGHGRVLVQRLTARGVEAREPQADT